jgi:hypothetical protein
VNVGTSVHIIVNKHRARETAWILDSGSGFQIGKFAIPVHLIPLLNRPKHSMLIFSFPAGNRCIVLADTHFRERFGCVRQ